MVMTVEKAEFVGESVLNGPVLVLNKAWHAIDATTVREALTTVVGEKAKIIHPRHFTLHDIEDWLEQEIVEGDRLIKSSRSSIIAPEVIVNHHDGVPHRKVVFSRRNLWKRDGFRCQYCGKRPSPDELTIDHVIPKAIWNRQNHTEMGITCFENCVLACVTCNKKKDNRTPEQAGMRLRHMEMRNGVLQPRYYERPKAPAWNPIYAVRRFSSFPSSWKQFVKTKDDELYWNVELHSE